MTRRGRPRQADRGTSVSSRVRVTPVRKAEINAALFAKALIAAQLLDDAAALPRKAARDQESPTKDQEPRKEEES